MTATTSTTRRPERLTTHYGLPGERIAPPPGYSRWGGQTQCYGDVRALYARDKSKRWERAGWVCTRCGVVELEPGLIGTERDQWHARTVKGRLDPESTYAGQLRDVDRHGVDTVSPATVLHRADPAGVDTPRIPLADRCACGHAAGAHMPECTGTGLCRCVEFRPVTSGIVYPPATSPGVDTARRAVDVAGDLAAALGVDTPLELPRPAPGWDPRERIPCPSCSATISASNLAKHRRRRHGTAA